MKNTCSFSRDENSQDDTKNSPSRNNDNLFQFVKKTGTNIRARLVNTEEFALGPKFGKTQPCNNKKCKCCIMIRNDDKFHVNGQLVRTAPGSCRTYNIIYLVRCSTCDEAYIGRTVKQLHERIHGHRAKFHDIINGNIIDINSDEYCLGVHLLEHGLTEHDDFNKTFKICIIENCSPKLLEYKENKYIHLIKTLKPWGLNTTNPFGINMFH